MHVVVCYFTTTCGVRGIWHLGAVSGEKCGSGEGYSAVPESTNGEKFALCHAVVPNLLCTNGLKHSPSRERGCGHWLQKEREYILLWGTDGTSESRDAKRMDNLKPGKTIGGYRLVESLGRGAMGEVFLGWHPDLQRTAAIKVLRPDVASELYVVKRFLREGKLVAQLDHPGIATIFDLGKERGRYYTAMEFLQGSDLEQLVKKEGPFAPDRALAVARQVAEALDHAHTYGIVHRDVKPSNIILADDGSARLTDFGVARLGGQETVLTHAGDILGSPVFMSPEQVRGAENADGRSDLYSLGATLYVLLSGKLPFAAKTLAATISQIVHDNPLPLETAVSDLSPAVASLVKRLMAKLPAARFQTGKEFCDAVDEVLQKGLTDPREDHAAKIRSARHKPAAEARPLLRAAWGAIAVCALVGGFYFLASDTGGSAASSSTATNVEPRIKEPGPEERGGQVGRHGHSGGSYSSIVRAELEERVLAFRDALLSGHETEALDFVDPVARTNRGLLASLGRIVAMVVKMGSRVSSQHTLEMHERTAHVVFFFHHEESSTIMKFPVTWIRQGGTWYAEPDSR